MEHTNRTIRPLTQQDLEAYLDIYLNAYPAYKTLDEACREHYREKHRLELREDRQVQTVGLFEGDVLIATMKLILFSMNCFGRMQTACGLMALEVHPLHKKKGGGAGDGAVFRGLRPAQRRASHAAAALPDRLLPADGLWLCGEALRVPSAHRRAAQARRRGPPPSAPAAAGGL